VNKVEYLEQEI